MKTASNLLTCEFNNIRILILYELTLGRNFKQPTGYLLLKGLSKVPVSYIQVMQPCRRDIAALTVYLIPRWRIVMDYYKNSP